MANLIIVRGLPGSGKTTLADYLCDAHNTSHHYEADHYFYTDGKYVWNRNKLREAHEWCLTSTKKALEEDAVVIVSNTFTTTKEPKPYFALAKEFGIIPTVYICQNSWGSIHSVPEDTIIAMKARFQHDISHLFKELE